MKLSSVVFSGYVAVNFLTLSVLLSSCGNSAPTADEHQSQVTSQMQAEADRAVPAPTITNWSEKRMVKDLYELRDKQGPTWTYMQSLDGRLICVGQSVGYGIPYAVQFTNPEKIINNKYDNNNNSAYDGPFPQPEPNGLFMPSTAEGTWVQLWDKTTKTAQAVYIEPRVTVSPFRLAGSVVAQDCKD